MDNIYIDGYIGIEVGMRKKLYISNWLSNTSVAAVIVGGFQEMSVWLRIFALCLALIAFIIGLKLAKED